MADLLNSAFNSGSIIKKFKIDATEALRRAEAASKCSREALSKMEAKLAKVKAGWASKKGKIELEVAKARMELAEARKEVAKAIEKYKSSKDFIA